MQKGKLQTDSKIRIKKTIDNKKRSAINWKKEITKKPSSFCLGEA